MNWYEMAERVRAQSEPPFDALDVEESLDSGNAMRAEVVAHVPAGIMQAGYAKPDDAPRGRVRSAVVRYCSAPLEPVWLPAETPSRGVRPADERAGLVDRVLDAVRGGRGDLADFARERRAPQRQRAHLLLEQLAARSAVSREICCEILEEECRVESQLWQFAGRAQQGLRCESRFASDLVRELEALRRESRAERVACWRDTTRIVCERWPEYGARWAGWTGRGV